MRIERRLVLIVGMRIAASRVGLPDLDEGIGNRAAIFIEDAPAHDDALANRLATGEVGQVDIRWTNQVPPETRAGNFRERMLDANKRLARRALDGTPVSVVRVWRMRAFLLAAI